MAKSQSKGSIILELIIIVLVAALVFTILYPKKIWEEEKKNTEKCRENMDRILKAELIYQKYNNNYTDSLMGLIGFFKADTTKEVVRDYFDADTALAEKMVKFLREKNTDANLLLKNLMADTLMFAIIETINYDSNLARVVLNRLEATSFQDTIKNMRNMDSTDVFILKKLNNEYTALDIIEPIENDDSLKLVFNRMRPEIPIGSQLDTLYRINSEWAKNVDSAVYFTIDDFVICPTVQREYIISVIDTSVIKYINIECPLDSSDVEQNKTDFVKYHLGHRRIENHGKIETGERSWAK